jgi:putative addiction module component (TIGR02574 family)
MPPASVSQLLKLPAAERAELAMTLWDSLTDIERDTAMDLAPEEAAELDRRWAEHIENPDSAIPWPEVQRKLQAGP